MPRRILEGNVVSNKSDKTITVLVERRYMHPVYKKYIKSTDKYTAHDENNQFAEGDRVSIIECRPISKMKRWTVITGDETPAKAPKEEKPKAKTAEKASNPAVKKDEVKKEAKKEEKPKAKKAETKKPAAKKEEQKETKKAAPKKKPAAKKAAAKKKDA